MAVASSPVVDLRPAATAGINWPSLVESLAALAAIAVLFPQFDRLATDDAGRDGRFADAAISVGGLPEHVLPALCASHGALAEPMVRDRLCRRSELRSEAAPPSALPRSVVEAYGQTVSAFRRPLAEAERRRGELRLQQREGLGDLLALGNAIESIDAELAPYIERYSLAGRGEAAPLPLACAFDAVKSAIGAPSERGDAAQANALLLLGAALDGHGATGALAAGALLPASRRSTEPGCSGLSLADALSRASLLVADARQARMRVAKNEAMRDLLHTAGWQWAGWMLAGLVLLKLSPAAELRARWRGARARRSGPRRRGSGACRGPSASIAPSSPARASASLHGAARAVRAGARRRCARRAHRVAVAAEATPLRTADDRLAHRLPGAGCSRPASAGCVLLDLSANGNFGNRYLALYHQGHLWLGMLTFTVVAFLRQRHWLARWAGRCR